MDSKKLFSKSDQIYRLILSQFKLFLIFCVLCSSQVILAQTCPPVWKSIGNSIYLDCDQDLKVGIGTDSPSKSLHVEGDFRTTGTSEFYGPLKFFGDGTGNALLVKDSTVNRFLVKGNGAMTSVLAANTVHIWNAKNSYDSVKLRFYASGAIESNLDAGSFNAISINQGNESRFSMDSHGQISSNLYRNATSALQLKYFNQEIFNIRADGSMESSLKVLNPIQSGLPLASVIWSAKDNTGTERFRIEPNGRTKWNVDSGSPFLISIQSDGIEQFKVDVDGSLESNGSGTFDGSLLATGNVTGSGEIVKLAQGTPVFTVKPSGAVLMDLSDDSENPIYITNSAGEDVFLVEPSGYIYANQLFAEKVTVELDPFPDYVFKKDYQLMSLDKLGAYIHSNERLPNMPSAKSVSEEGADLGEMNRLLIEKVEELTLYILQLNERVIELEGSDTQSK